MKQEQDHIVEQDYFDNTLSVDGDIYISNKVIRKKIDGIDHIKKVIYKKATKKELGERIDKLVKALKKKTNIDEVLRELIKDRLANVRLKQINRELEKGKPVKKHKGCLGFKIGKRYIQLIR